MFLKDSPSVLIFGYNKCKGDLLGGGVLFAFFFNRHFKFSLAELKYFIPEHYYHFSLKLNQILELTLSYL